MKMFKKLMATLAVTLGSLALVGCGGQTVEIPTGFVGKVQTKDGFQDGDARLPSKFRLDQCFRYCDRLVLLDVSDSFYEMKFNTFMPKDELMLEYDIEMTMSVDPNKYDFIFGNVPFKEVHDQLGVIEQRAVFSRYARAKLNTIIPSILAEYTISEVASNRQQINTFVQKRLNKELSDTPFVLKVVGVTDVVYPKTITAAQEASAERRQQEDTVKAQRKLDLLQIKTREEVSKRERAIELYEAKTKSLVADELLSDNYRFLETQKTLREMAKGGNTFVVSQDTKGQILINASK